MSMLSKAKSGGLIIAVSFLMWGCKSEIPTVSASAAQGPSGFILEEQPSPKSPADGESWGIIKMAMPGRLYAKHRPVQGAEIGTATVTDSAKHSLKIGAIYAPWPDQKEMFFYLPRVYSWKWKNPILNLEFNDHQRTMVPLGELPAGETVNLGKVTPTKRVECYRVDNFQKAGIWGMFESTPGRPEPGLLLKLNPPVATSRTGPDLYTVGILDTDLTTNVNGVLDVTAPNSKFPKGYYFGRFGQPEMTHRVCVGIRHAKLSPDEETFEFPNCKLVSKFGGTGFQLDEEQTKRTRTGWVLKLQKQYSGPLRNVKRDSRSIEIKYDLKYVGRSLMPDGKPMPRCLNSYRDTEVETKCEIEIVSPSAADLGLNSIQIGPRAFKPASGKGLVHYGTFTLKLKVKSVSKKELGVEKFVIPVMPLKG
jgi:hypothetical protein